MTDRPILFSAPMVRALLEGRKTQTRRVLKGVPEWCAKDRPGYSCFTPPGHISFRGKHPVEGYGEKFVRLPYSRGDRLWVREAHVILPRTVYHMSIGTGTIAQQEHPSDGYSAALFREGFDRSGRPSWRPSIHMPRWASRLTLNVTDVRVQRLKDISEADAEAEGCASGVGYKQGYGFTADATFTARDFFHDLWDSLNAKRGYGWDANPWVCAVTFAVHQRNIDQMEAAA